MNQVLGEDHWQSRVSSSLSVVRGCHDDEPLFQLQDGRIWPVVVQHRIRERRGRLHDGQAWNYYLSSTALIGRKVVGSNPGAGVFFSRNFEKFTDYM